MYLRRRVVLLTLAVSAAVVLTLAASTFAKDAKSLHKNVARSLSGTWSGKYSGPFNGTFTLRWTQSGGRLTGTITLSSPRGKYPITGSVRGGDIKFGAVGVGTTYTGTVSGKSMSGTYKTGPRSGSWSAKKTS